MKLKMKKVLYNPNTKSEPIEAILHTNEIVLNVKVAKELYNYLNSDKKEMPLTLKNKLLYLYHHTPEI